MINLMSAPESYEIEDFANILETGLESFERMYPVNPSASVTGFRVQMIIGQAIKLALKLKIPFITDFQIICESNLQKFDVSEVDAQITGRLYHDQGVATYYKQHGDLFVTRSFCEQQHGNKIIPVDKILKSHHWIEPVFPDMAW
jgi:hypothetical protein